MLEPSDLTRLHRLLLLVFLLIAAPQAYAATPSFDCAKASSRIETSICTNAQLAQLDARLAAELKAAVKRATSNRETVLADQRNWLEKRDKKCISHSADPQTSQWQVTECLADQYQERIAQLKSTPSICETMIGRLRPMIEKEGHTDADTSKSYWALNFLATQKSSGVIIRKPVIIVQGPRREWKADLLSALGVWKIDADTSDNIDANLEAGSSISITKVSDEENLYVLQTPQGKHSCPHDDFFKINNGKLNTLDMDVDDAGGDGDVCVKGRGFGAIDGIPAIMDVENIPPSLRETISLRLLSSGNWTPPCAMDFEFEAEFPSDIVSQPFLNVKKCTNIACEQLRAAGVTLVKFAQSDPAHVEYNALSNLPKEKIALYERMKSLAKLGRSFLDCSPTGDEFFAPVFANDEMYLAHFGHDGHGCIGVTNPFWSIEISRLDKDKLDGLDYFEVGVEEGRLLGTKTYWLSQP